MPSAKAPDESAIHGETGEKAFAEFLQGLSRGYFWRYVGLRSGLRYASFIFGCVDAAVVC